jgi:quinoprotein glucose dehydrogenase
MTLTALAFVVAAVPAGSQEPSPRSVQEGVYTAAQAERGKQVYKQACSECHALDWYRGEAMEPWNGAPLFDLYELIATLMPQNNPGSLKRREYVDLVAFLLSLNEMPAGAKELPTQPSDLKQILIKWRDKP